MKPVIAPCIINALATARIRAHAAGKQAAAGWVKIFSDDDFKIPLLTAMMAAMMQGAMTGFMQSFQQGMH